MTSSSDSLPFVLKTNLHPVYHHPTLPPISADSILTSLQASTRSSSSKRPRSPSRSPSPSSPSTPRTKIQKLSSSSSSIPSAHHLNFNSDTLSPSPPQLTTLFDQPNSHTLSSESQLSTAISIDSPNSSNVNRIDFKPAASSTESILQNEYPSSNSISDHGLDQILVSPSTILLELENIPSGSHSLLPTLDCPNPLSSSESSNLHTISLAEEMAIEPAITPSSSPLSSPLSSPPSIGPTHTPQTPLCTSPSAQLANLQKPSDTQEHQIQSSVSPQKLPSDTFKMPTFLKLTPSKPALPLTISCSPSSNQVIRSLPSSTLPGLSACPATHSISLSSSISSLDPSEQNLLNKSASILKEDVPKSPDMQSSLLEKSPQTTTSTSINPSNPPNLKNFNSNIKSSPGSINRFFSRTTMTERPEEMQNVLSNSIELGTLFKSGSSHLCPPDRSPPLRTSPTKPLILESNTSALNLSEALVELQSEKENGDGLLTKRPTRASKISQRLEAMKKQTKRKAGRVESTIPISNPTAPSTIFRESNTRDSKNDSTIKLLSVTKRFTAVNEHRVCVLKVEDWEMKKPRPPSPVSFSKTCRKYIKDHDEEEEEEEDLGMDEKSGIRFRKVKWKKPLAEDVEIVGKLMEVPKKGILVKKNEIQLDSDGNLMGESNMKILPEFVIVKRKVWSR